jgi:hypothetical protein
VRTAKSGTHGEGDYEATRRFRKRSESFIAKHDVTKLARQAAPRSKDEARELQQAEASGRARAKGRTKSTPAPAGRRRATSR